MRILFFSLIVLFALGRLGYLFFVKYPKAKEEQKAIENFLEGYFNYFRERRVPPKKAQEITLLDLDKDYSDLSSSFLKLNVRYFKNLQKLNIAIQPDSKEDLEKLLLLPRLQELRIRLGTDFSFLAKLKSLKTLEISYSNFQDKDFYFIKDLTELKALKIASEMIKGEGFDYLRNLKSLNKFTILTGNYLFSSYHFYFLKELPFLKEIHLLGTQMKNQDFSFLEGLSTLTTLNLLWTNIEDEALLSVGTLKNLEFLALQSFRNEIKGGGLKYLGTLENLKTLKISCNATFEAIPSFLKLKKLKRLTLEWIQALDLKPFLALESLEKLSLKDSKFKNDEQLKYLKNFKKLTHLEINSTHIRVVAPQFYQIDHKSIFWQNFVKRRKEQLQDLKSREKFVYKDLSFARKIEVLKKDKKPNRNVFNCLPTLEHLHYFAWVYCFENSYWDFVCFEDALRALNGFNQLRELHFCDMRGLKYKEIWRLESKNFPHLKTLYLSRSHKNIEFNFKHFKSYFPGCSVSFEPCSFHSSDFRGSCITFYEEAHAKDFFKPESEEE